MKKILFPMIAFLFVASCSKDKDNADKGIDPGDATTVAASITVKNSEKQTGNMPQPGSNFILGIGGAVGKSVKTIAGKYAVLEPYTQGGTATGYYVQVKGSSGHFKVTASAGNIVIQLPENINTGKFTVSVIAFDANNNLSNTAEAIIEIVKLGGTGSENFTGTWKLTGKQKSNGSWDHDIYGQKNGTAYTYQCHNDKIVPYSNMNPQLETIYIAVQQTDLKKAELVFEQAGTIKKTYQEDNYMLNFGTSSCHNLLYNFDASGGVNYTLTLGLVYNATTKKMIFLYYYDAPGTPAWATYSEEFEVLEFSATKMIIKYTDYGYAYEYTRQ